MHFTTHYNMRHSQQKTAGHNIQNQEQITARDVVVTQWSTLLYFTILPFYHFDTNFNEFLTILYSVFSYTF
jgi:hypothetical protein